MKCDLCGTNVKVVGHTTKHYEPVVDKDMIVEILMKPSKSKDMNINFGVINRYKAEFLADAIISAMYGDNVETVKTINEWGETMSKAHQDIKVENLIAEYRELSDSWNGKCLKTEKKMQDIAGELEDYGIMVEDLD